MSYLDYHGQAERSRSRHRPTDQSRRALMTKKGLRLRLARPNIVRLSGVEARQCLRHKFQKIYAISSETTKTSRNLRFK